MIAQLCDALFIALMLLNLLMLGSNRTLRMLNCIRLQGVSLALLCLLWPGSAGMRAILLAVAVIALKVLFLPHLLSKAIRILKARYENKPYLGFGATMFWGAVGTTIAFLLSDAWPLQDESHQNLLLPTSLTCFWCGFLLMTVRLKPASQLMGFFVFDNGLFLWAALMLSDKPCLVGYCLLPNLFLTLLAWGIRHPRLQGVFALMDPRDQTQSKEE